MEIKTKAMNEINMNNKDLFFSNYLFKLLEYNICNFLKNEQSKYRLNNIFHVVGANGSGKSTLILEFLRYSMIHLLKSIYIIDNEGSLSKKKIQNNSILSKYSKDIFLSKIMNIKSLNEILTRLLVKYRSNPNEMPPKILIINSLSRIIKTEIGFCEDYFEYLKIMKVISTQIFPKIIELSKKFHFSIILTHHISYNSIYHDMIPYYGDIMKNLKGIWIFLKKKTKFSDSYENKDEITYFQDLAYNSDNLQRNDMKNKRIEKKFQYRLDKGRFLIFKSHSYPI